MKDKKAKSSLIAYINQHPEQRLWQAILNWSGFSYLLLSPEPPKPKSGLQDTFHIRYDDE